MTKPSDSDKQNTDKESGKDSAAKYNPDTVSSLNEETKSADQNTGDGDGENNGTDMGPNDDSATTDSQEDSEDSNGMLVFLISYPLHVILI